jgi:site-specific DNA recombinase
MNIAFAYIRRSSYKQIDNNSVEIQKGQIQQFAARNNMTVPDEFIFIEDATSAYTNRASQRKKLMHLKERMIESGISRVIFHEESRMDRTGYTFILDFYRPLSEHFSDDLSVYSTNLEGPLNPDNPQTKLAFLLYRQESEIKSERAISSLVSYLETNEAVRPGAKTPYGYTVTEKKLVPNEEADIVTFIFYLQSWGISMQKIADILTSAGIPSPQGKAWRSSTIENILKNRLYTGTLIWNVHKGKAAREYEFHNFTEPLVDEFVVQLINVNTTLQKVHGRLDTPFTFLNKLVCSQCNEKLLTQNASTTRNGKKYLYQYYVCKTCSYKLDITNVHDSLLPKLFRHIENHMSNEELKSHALTYLEQANLTIEKNIEILEERLDKLISRGCIAEEQNDKRLQELAETLQNRTDDDLKEASDKLDVLQSVSEAVQSDLFFNRFKTMLEIQFGETEKPYWFCIL